MFLSSVFQTLSRCETQNYSMWTHAHASALLIYPHQCDHPLLSGWAGWERGEWQEEEEEEEGVDRNGRLRQAWSRLCMNIDSCRVCSNTRGHMVVACCTHPHLTDERDTEVGLCVFECAQRTDVIVQVDVCICLPVWHWEPIQPNGQAHWLGLKQVPPFAQACPHTAVREN